LNKKIEEIFRQYYSPLCNYAAKIITDRVLAEDIVQSLFIQLWETNKLASVNNHEHFLLKATKYKCIDYLRSKKLKKEVLLDDMPDTFSASYSDLSEEDIEPLLYYFAAKLPLKTKEVFLLSRTSGLTYSEIANELDISIKTVENQMGRALRMMRVLLKEQEFLAIALLLKILQ
jgi:RNA polymerase sigma-70 factor (ECF subfamily)